MSEPAKARRARQKRMFERLLGKLDAAKAVIGAAKLRHADLCGCVDDNPDAEPCYLAAAFKKWETQ